MTCVHPSNMVKKSGCLFSKPWTTETRNWGNILSVWSHPIETEKHIQMKMHICAANNCQSESRAFKIQAEFGRDPFSFILSNSFCCYFFFFFVNLNPMGSGRTVPAIRQYIKVCFLQVPLSSVHHSCCFGSSPRDIEGISDILITMKWCLFVSF